MTLIELKSPEHVDGTVHLTQQYQDLYGMARVDLLQEWIAVLTELYILEKSVVFGHDYQMHKPAQDAIFINGRSISGYSQNDEDNA